MFLSLFELELLLAGIPNGNKTSDDEFFTAANEKLVPKFKKLGVISNLEENNPKKDTSLSCSVPGCFEIFENVVSYQTHYNTAHRYLCVSCKRALPTPHLLDIHISENHSQYFQARVERGEPMYVCFLEECQSKLFTPEDRMEHCIKSHKFPSNFRFGLQCFSGSKKSKKNQLQMDTDEQSTKPAVLNTKLKTIQFGHNVERNFDRTCTKRATFENMDELMDALEE